MLAHLSLTTPRGTLTADLDPKGITTIAGPTGAGKSALVAAGVALLTGERFYGSTVEGRSGGNTALRIDQAGKDRSFAAEGKAPYRGKVASDFRRWSPLGADVELVHAITGHQGGARWQDLAAGTGQDLRDLLVRVLPPVDLRARILEAVAAAGHTADAGLLVVRVRAGKSEVTLDAADPSWPEQLVKALEAAQTEANRAETAATARAEQADATVQRLRRELPTPPDTEALKAAATTDATAKAWAAYDEAVARHEADVARVAEQRAVRDAWQARRAAIGRAPVLDTVALTAAEKAVTEAAVLLKRLEREEQDAAVMAARQVPPPQEGSHAGPMFTSTCPACGQAMPGRAA